MQVMWDNPEQTILRLVFEPQWTRDHFRVGLETIWQTLDQINYPANVILDQTAAAMPASGFFAHAKVMGGLSEHPHIGAIIIVGADRETRALCATASYRNTLCQHLNFVDTLEDAYAVLSQLDFVAGLNNLLDDWVS